MLRNFFRADSLLLESQYLQHQVLGLFGNIGPVVVDQRHCASFSQGLNLLEEGRVEGELSRQHEVQDDAQTEGVNFLVKLLLFVDLGGDEAGRPCELLLEG